MAPTPARTRASTRPTIASKWYQNVSHSESDRDHKQTLTQRQKEQQLNSEPTTWNQYSVAKLSEGLLQGCERRPSKKLRAKASKQTAHGRTMCT